MAIALVGSPVTQSVLADSTSFVRSAVQDNWLVLAFSSFDGVGLPTVSDGVLTWARAVVKAGASDQVEIWYALVIGNATYTVTVNLPGTGQAISGALVEVSGLVASSALDAVNGVDSSGTSVGTGLTGTLSQPNQILFAAMTHDGATPSITEDAGAGWSLIYEQEDNNTRQSFALVSKIVSATTSTSHTWTIGASVNAHGVIATFKEAAGGGGVVIPVLTSSGRRRRAS